MTGIEKDRLVITADAQTAALARVAGLVGPYVRRTMDRQVRQVRQVREPTTRLRREAGERRLVPSGG